MIYLLIEALILIIFLILKRGGFMTWPVATVGSVAKTDFNNLVLGLQESNIFDNILINGGFEIWQRGNSFTGADKFTADVWYMSGGGTGYTVSRESSIVHSGNYSLKVVCTEDLVIKQTIENYKEYQGKAISLSVWVKSSATGQMCLKIDDGVGNTLSAYNTTTGWEELTVTRTIDASATKLEISLMIYSDATVYFDDVMCVQGSEAAGFTPRSPSLEYDLCDRWYEKGTYRSSLPTTNKILRFNCRFRVRKAGSSYTISFVFVVLDDSDNIDTTHWSLVTSPPSYTDDYIFIELQRDIPTAGHYYVNADWNVQVDS
jgi:hypothetical protein